MITPKFAKGQRRRLSFHYRGSRREPAGRLAFFR
jgi:hypothetical protein